MMMHPHDSRHRAHRPQLPLHATDGVQRVAKARRLAIAHCLAHALAVRVLRRHHSGHQFRVVADFVPKA